MSYASDDSAVTASFPFFSQPTQSTNSSVVSSNAHNPMADLPPELVELVQLYREKPQEYDQNIQLNRQLSQPSSIASRPNSNNKRKYQDVTPLSSLVDCYTYSPETDEKYPDLVCMVCYSIFKDPYSHKCGATVCSQCFHKAK